MSEILHYIKRGIKRAAVLFSVVALSAAASLSLVVPAFYGYEGRRESYFENGSFSDGVREEKDLGFYELIRGKKGEAVLTDAATAEKIITDFGAKLVYKENFAGGENAYYYTEKLPFSARLNGKTVNLQIYRVQNGAKAGTPIIYGGF